MHTKQKRIYKSKVNMVVLRSFIVVLLLSVFMIPVLADRGELTQAELDTLAAGGYFDPTPQAGYEITNMGKLALQLIYSIIKPDPTIVDALTVNFSVTPSGNVSNVQIAGMDNTGILSSVVSTLSTVTSGLRTLAVVFAFAFCFVGLAKDFVSGQAYGEIALKKIAVLVTTIALVYITPYVVYQIMNAGTGLMQRINVSGQSPNVIGSFYKSVMDTYTDSVCYQKGGWLRETIGSFNATMSALSLILQAAIPYLMRKISVLGLKVIAYTRAVEMILVGSFSPFAVALNTYDHGESAKRFFKQAVSLAIQGAIIFTGYWIFSALTNSFLGTGADAGDFAKLIDLALISVCTLGFAAKSRGIANAIVGL